ncbi:hypothetical protein KOR34_10130 [Posidoniimonas corsicana]|uniref:Methyltransferase FkbM domain-containing protein n=1 Tax=Posidoniimonas corsicana TaxID=1938618 RepID=A0A5C5VBV3_9BACT|nr:50S ribosomal protein L11 methyltransferase [Posidoniimonas corsicana]TWT36114.1 hypothetical protein KOR34_10130 [Posidoniimonas corsicana]
MRLSSVIKNHATPRAILRRWAVAQAGKRVQAGPFRGMHYIDQAFGSAYVPKVLGTYERELYPVLEEVLSADYDTLIDVGVAEGYFAVGMAGRSQARVVGYECDAAATAMAKELARLNNVENQIEMRGECTPAELEGLIASSAKPFLLCDVDGYETELLDPRRVGSLTRCAMLVELHEFARPGVTAEFLRRFGATHDIEILWQSPRTAADFPFEGVLTRLLPSRYRRHMVDELRPSEQSWLWMTPKAPQAAAA